MMRICIFAIVTNLKILIMLHQHGTLNNCEGDQSQYLCNGMQKQRKKIKIIKINIDKLQIAFLQYPKYFVISINGKIRLR